MNEQLNGTKKDLGTRTREMRHTIDPTKRRALALENFDWCSLRLPDVDSALDSKRAEYWRHNSMWFGAQPEGLIEREIDDQVREARHYRVGSFAFQLVECVAAAILAAIYFQAPLLLALSIGITLAFLLGGAAGAVVTRWVRHDAALQPTKQLERVTRGLLVLGIPWLMASVMALSILRSAGSTVGTSLFFAATTAVTLLSPLCSGLCTCAFDLLSWSRRVCADIRWIRGLDRDLKHLLLISKRSVGGLKDESGISEATRRALGPVSAAVLAIATLVGGASEQPSGRAGLLLC
jgi:hypothetical protein